MENLDWNEKMLPSQLLKQIRDKEEKSPSKTTHNIVALTMAIGKAESIEYLAAIKTADSAPKKAEPKPVTPKADKKPEVSQ
jgi:hypothetical protein